METRPPAKNPRLIQAPECGGKVVLFAHRAVQHLDLDMGGFVRDLPAGDAFVAIGVRALRSPTAKLLDDPRPEEAGKSAMVPT